MERQQTRKPVSPGGQPQQVGTDQAGKGRKGLLQHVLEGRPEVSHDLTPTGK